MNYQYGNELLSKYYDLEEIDTKRTGSGISLCRHSDYIEGGPTGWGTNRYHHVDMEWFGGENTPPGPDGDNPCVIIASCICLGIGCIGCYNIDTICPAITNFICDICC